MGFAAYVYFLDTCRYVWCPKQRGPSTMRECYPIPHIQDCSVTQWTLQFFQKCLVCHQVLVPTEDVPKTTVMPFGLKVTALTFQMLMDSALRDLTFIFI